MTTLSRIGTRTTPVVSEGPLLRWRVLYARNELCLKAAGGKRKSRHVFREMPTLKMLNIIFYESAASWQVKQSCVLADGGSVPCVGVPRRRRRFHQETVRDCRGKIRRLNPLISCCFTVSFSPRATAQETQFVGVRMRAHINEI